MNFPLAFLSLLLAANGIIGQTSMARPDKRKPAPWPPSAGELRVVIDADAANEVDDPWAIALALGFPERLKIEGFVASSGPLGRFLCDIRFDYAYDFQQTNGLLLRITRIDRDVSFNLLDDALKRIGQQPGKTKP